MLTSLAKINAPESCQMLPTTCQMLLSLCQMLPRTCQMLPSARCLCQLISTYFFRFQHISAFQQPQFVLTVGEGESHHIMIQFRTENMGENGFPSTQNHCFALREPKELRRKRHKLTLEPGRKTYQKHARHRKHLEERMFSGGST